MFLFASWKIPVYVIFLIHVFLCMYTKIHTNTKWVLNKKKNQQQKRGGSIPSSPDQFDTNPSYFLILDRVLSLWLCSWEPVACLFSQVHWLHLCHPLSSTVSLQRTILCFLQPFLAMFKNFLFFLLQPSSETQRGPLTPQIILDLWSATGLGRGSALPSGSLSYLKSTFPVSRMRSYFLCRFWRQPWILLEYFQVS